MSYYNYEYESREDEALGEGYSQAAVEMARMDDEFERTHVEHIAIPTALEDEVDNGSLESLCSWWRLEVYQFSLHKIYSEEAIEWMKGYIQGAKMWGGLSSEAFDEMEFLTKILSKLK